MVRGRFVHNLTVRNKILMQMLRIEQKFTHAPLADVKGAVISELERMQAQGLIRSGERVAVGVGSRGVDNTALVIKTLIDFLKDSGNYPFIVPAMGSHGGATAEGQKAIMASYGITEQSMGVKIEAGTETVNLGRTAEHGVPVYVYKPAYEADLVIPVNRIKVHTDYKGPIESGIHKMLAIGLGNLAGASSLHTYGSARSFHWLIPEVGQYLAHNIPFRFGLGLVEDSYDQTAAVRALPLDTLYEEEHRLLEWSRTMLPRFLMPEFDILVVERFGKDISGAGMDPNIVGRTSIPGSIPFPGPRFQYCVVLDLTEGAHGNAAAISCADIITRRFFDKIDLQATYQNCLACHNPHAAKIPVIADDEEAAIDMACEICTDLTSEDGKPRIVRIKDTLHMGEILVSPNMWNEIKDIPGITLLGPAEV